MFTFRSELRHMVMGLDRLLLPRKASLLGQTWRNVARAAFTMAEQRVGALLVLVRQDSIDELLDGGVDIGAQISAELLEALFQKSSPLHDGAAILEGDRVRKANVVLPLTERREVPHYYGTRHRAAMGLAERSDALVIAVSEERGEVTLMDGAIIRVMRAPEQLAGLLEKLQAQPQVRLQNRVRRLFTANRTFKLAALGLAAAIWSISFVGTAGTTVRLVTVPIEFSNVPAGMEIASQSTDVLDVQVRGASWLIDSVSLARLVAHFDLRHAHRGDQTLTVSPNVLRLPPGMIIERVEPDHLTVRLLSR
jgi:hypothetical protein